MGIKDQVIEYRNTHQESRTLLSAVLGEFDRVSKNPTDEKCISIIKGLIDNTSEEEEIDLSTISERD